MDKTEEFADTMRQIRETNRVLIHRQGGGRYIFVKDKSKPIVLVDFCINENGKLEDMEWGCEHENTSWEAVQAPGGYFEPNETMATVCLDCESVLADGVWSK